MYRYHLSFYGQTIKNVRECLKRLAGIEPHIIGSAILNEPISCGPNPPSHTVELHFESQEACFKATKFSQILAQTYLPFAVGEGFIPKVRKAPLDLTPDLVAYRREQRTGGPAPVKEKERPVLKVVY